MNGAGLQLEPVNRFEKAMKTSFLLVRRVFFLQKVPYERFSSYTVFLIKGSQNGLLMKGFQKGLLIKGFLSSEGSPHEEFSLGGSSQEACPLRRLGR